ncbi:MAG: hypothetical protein P8Y76_11935 [bacterium]
MDDVVVGDDQAHRCAVDEFGFVLLDRGHFRGALDRAQRFGVVEPDFRDAVVGGLAFFVGAEAGVGLDVAPQAGEFLDDFGVSGAPVRLEFVDRHAGAAFEVGDGLNHGLVRFASYPTLPMQRPRRSERKLALKRSAASDGWAPSCCS